MSLLLGGLLGGVGQGMLSNAKISLDEEAELRKEAREDKKLSALTDREDKKLSAQMTIAEMKDNQQLRLLEAQIIKSEIQAGATERAAQIRANSMIQAIMAKGDAGSNKPTETDRKFMLAEEAIAGSNGLLPSELRELSLAQQRQQYTPNLAGQVLQGRGLLTQDNGKTFVLGGDGVSQIPVNAQDLPSLANRVTPAGDMLKQNEKALTEYNQYKLNGGKQQAQPNEQIGSMRLALDNGLKAVDAKLAERGLTPEAKAVLAAQRNAILDKQLELANGVLKGQQSTSGSQGIDAYANQFITP